MMRNLMQNWAIRWMSGAVAGLALAGTASAAPSYGAVFLGANYPGGPAFDDNLAASSGDLAATFATWPNWTRGVGGNIVELPGATAAAGYLAAMNRFQPGGANALGAGDVFVAFYFGHGSRGGASNERRPAINNNDEFLSFPNGSSVTDDQMTTAMNAFAPGVKKMFINVSCMSGGFLNGNDRTGEGDLETVAGTTLMFSSAENQLTFPAGLAPRPEQPLILRNLIQNGRRPARDADGLSVIDWYTPSAVAGSGSGDRFGTDDPGDGGSDSIFSPGSGDFESGLAGDSSMFSTLLFVPEPASLGLLMFGALFLRARRPL